MRFFSKKIEPTLIQPTFVTHLPKELCPLAKLNQEDAGLIDVFRAVHRRHGSWPPAYSEQNDPFVQRQMFEAQAGEDQQKMDTDFLLAPRTRHAARPGGDGRRHRPAVYFTHPGPRASAM